jgi:hypothetical protein
LPVEIAVGQPEAALLHDAQVPLLDAEHVEVVAEAPRTVKLAARGGDPVEPVAAAEVLRALHPPLDETEHEHAPLREVGDDGRAHSNLRRGDRVLVLVLTVDREQARVLGRDSDDVRPSLGLDLVVRVRQAARELGDRLRAGQLGHELDDLLNLGLSAHVA